MALLPESLADCIVVYELCYLQEFNRSQRFWKLIAKAMPNYQNIKQEPRINRINFY